MKNSLRIHKWTHNEFNIFILGVLTRPLFGCFSIKILLFLWYFTKNDYAEFVSFCATSVDWKSLHSVGEQPSFVLKIR